MAAITTQIPVLYIIATGGHHEHDEFEVVEFQLRCVVQDLNHRYIGGTLMIFRFRRFMGCTRSPFADCPQAKGTTINRMLLSDGMGGGGWLTFSCKVSHRNRYVPLQLSQLQENGNHRVKPR